MGTSQTDPTRSTPRDRARDLKRERKLERLSLNSLLLTPAKLRWYALRFLRRICRKPLT